MGHVPLLKGVMLLFGLASGIATNSALCLMLDLTLPGGRHLRGGLGAGQALSRPSANFWVGGPATISPRTLFPGAPPLAPYALVFGIEALVALLPSCCWRASTFGSSGKILGEA